MESYDVLMLLILAGTTIFGAWKGMAWQLASLASLVISYVVALKFSPQLTPLFGQTPPWNRVLAMLALYMGTSMAIWMAFRVVAGFIDRLKLQEFDRQLGALVGLSKGVLLCVVVTVFAAALLPDQQRQTIMKSRSGYYVAVVLDRAHAVLPEEVHEVLAPYIHRAQETLEPGSSDHLDDGGPTEFERRLPEAAWQ
jgi:membrane protein required for colicin V production